MASIRTARTLAVLAAAPLALGVCAGVAQADSVDGLSGNSIIGGGVGDDLAGNSTVTQQSSVGFGNSNESNAASVNGFGVIDQSDKAFTLIVANFLP
ncbi:hypothetical protein ACL02R_20240 [Streptomyces sp. MS19]|uniref:hypothetical protein n=1 Tax=Streptomyces sp. MS19 TaxID=3385972 RepID=UPI0039A191B0